MTLNLTRVRHFLYLLIVPLQICGLHLLARFDKVTLPVLQFYEPYSNPRQKSAHGSKASSRAGSPTNFFSHSQLSPESVHPQVPASLRLDAATLSRMDNDIEKAQVDNVDQGNGNTHPYWSV